MDVLARWRRALARNGGRQCGSADSVGPPATRKGWQRCAGAAVEKRALELLFSDLDPASRALLLSQSGPGASCAMTVLPTGPEFRIMLLRRLRTPLPLAPKRCRCGGALDEYGDHRSACAQVGVLAHRAGPLERAAARVCREAGARVAASTALRDMNLDLPASDARRIEVFFFFLASVFTIPVHGIGRLLGPQCVKHARATWTAAQPSASSRTQPSGVPSSPVGCAGARQQPPNSVEAKARCNVQPSCPHPETPKVFKFKKDP